MIATEQVLRSGKSMLVILVPLCRVSHAERVKFPLKMSMQKKKLLVTTLSGKLLFLSIINPTSQP